jgi:hypothetical protein
VRLSVGAKGERSGGSFAGLLTPPPFGRLNPAELGAPFSQHGPAVEAKACDRVFDRAQPMADLVESVLGKAGPVSRPHAPDPLANALHPCRWELDDLAHQSASACQAKAQPWQLYSANVVHAIVTATILSTAVTGTSGTTATLNISIARNEDQSGRHRKIRKFCFLFRACR